MAAVGEPHQLGDLVFHGDLDQVVVDDAPGKPIDAANPRPVQELEEHVAPLRRLDEIVQADPVRTDVDPADRHRPLQTYEGLAAIDQWRREAAAKFTYTCEPLRSEQTNGKTIVTCRLEGNFPGSPVDLRFIFGLERGKIGSLEIEV